MVSSLAILNHVSSIRKVMASGTCEGFRFPECWNDDVRMDSLFAPFRQRNINPNNFDSKMNFWVSLIEKWCLYNKSPVVDLGGLNEQFRRKNKIPSCLPHVFNHLQKNKMLISKESYHQMVEQSWTKWAVNMLVTNPLRWTVKTVKTTILQNNGCDDSILLHLPVIEKLAQEVVQNVPADNKGRLLDANDLLVICGMHNMEHLEMILCYLCKQKLVALYQYQKRLLVKFPQENNIPTITDIDKALFSLEQNKKMLEINIKRLEGKSKLYIEEARKHVKANKINMAKASLRRSKVVESVIRKMANGLDNVENLIYEMDITSVNTVVMDSYQTGIQALKKYFKDTNLTKENVVSARQELEEILIFKMDIDEVISRSLDNKAPDETNEVLEEELKGLLEENFLPKLPDVPKHNLSEVKTIDKMEKKFASLAL